MKLTLLTTTIILCGSMLFAQEKDPDRMNRDLKIAEDIIASLVKSESEGGNFYSVRPKATYIEGFGVMVNIRSNNHFYSKNFNQSFSFSWDDGSGPMVIEMEELEELEEQAEILAEQAEEMARMHESEARRMEAKGREMEREAREMENRERRKVKVEIKNNVDVDVECCDEDEEMRRNVIVIQTDEDQEEIEEEMTELYENVMITFFTDYADLIGQLDENEKIMLTADLGGYGHAMFDDEQKSKISAVVSRKNISSYKSGKMSRDKFEDSIEFSEEEGAKKSPDLELLSSIFQRLYKSDLATTFYNNGRVSYERMEGFGVIYKMKVLSSTSYGRDNHKITTTGESGLTKKERDEIVNGMYPQFEKELKENILDYAKTIKSLSESETVIFQVKLTECSGCDMPKQIDVSVSQSVLKAYDSGKMKREDAIKQISVKRST